MTDKVEVKIELDDELLAEIQAEFLAYLAKLGLQMYKQQQK